MRLDHRPLDLGGETDGDLDLLHAWVTHPRSAFWMMQGASREEVRAEYAALVATDHHRVLVGLYDGDPAFLFEAYDPAHDPVGKHLDVGPGDVGMHLLVAPPDRPVHGFTRTVMRYVVATLLADPGVRRVVVEPDVDNVAVRRLNREVGFVEHRAVDLPGKTAMLSTCEREAFTSRSAAGSTPPGLAPGLAPALLDHLAPERMARAHRAQCAKTLAELSHERVLRPRHAGGDAASAAGADWELDGDHPRVGWRFRARVLAGDHWVVRPGSVRRVVDGAEQEPDAQQLVLDLRVALGLSDQVLPTYLEEVASTLAGRCRKDDPAAPTSPELVHADFQAVEAAMTEGHPCFVANNGRVGFDVVDVAAYAPETGPRLRLQWLAAHRDHATLSLAADLEADRLWEEELDPAVRAGFDRQLRARGLDPASYLLLPCHPWQWRHKVAVTFAPEVAAGLLVPLGEGPDAYQPQQSIRTYFNVDRPDRRYVKTALSVLNMGFMRGLSATYMEATPAINDVVADLVDSDPTLRRIGFSVLREVAAVGFRPPAQTAAGPSAYTKMLAALWRESPVDRVAPGERLASMTSLLHVDRHGVALAAELVRASGLEPRGWVERYLEAYLVPVVHCLAAHGLAFMPHGENVILVLRDHVPVRVLMKDIGEEVAVCSPDTPVPEVARRIRAEVTDEQLALAVHGDVVDGFLRHLAGLLDDAGVLPAATFWAVAAEVVTAHREAHPELGAALARLDLQRDEVPLMCLNRLQLRDNRHMVDLTDPESALVLAGTLPNPLAG